MVDIREINPLTPLWPVKPGEKPAERKRPPEQRRRKPRDERPDDDEDDKRHIDDYA